MEKWVCYNNGESTLKGVCACDEEDYQLNDGNNHGIWHHGYRDDFCGS